MIYADLQRVRAWDKYAHEVEAEVETTDNIPRIANHLIRSMAWWQLSRSHSASDPQSPHRLSSKIKQVSMHAQVIYRDGVGLAPTFQEYNARLLFVVWDEKLESRRQLDIKILVSTGGREKLKICRNCKPTTAPQFWDWIGGGGAAGLECRCS